MEPGSRIAHFEVLGLIGAGGMGEVYRACDTRLGRDVAIKVMPAELAADPDRLRRFEQEARAVAALNHPNILALYDVGTHEGAPYIVAELLEGESLHDRLRSGGLPVRKAVETAVQIAQGLAAAHEKGIIHRDLKPGNVFVTKDGHVKILDFGIAKLTHPESAPDPYAKTSSGGPSTDSGAVLGTLGYTSPEQLRGQPADARSDIFSFGCVLYQMLSGRFPFLKRTGPETASAILTEDPPPLAASGRAVAPALQEIVSRCLEKRPEERFSSAHDLALALRAYSGGSETPATVPTRVLRAPRRRLLGVLGVLILGVAVALLIWAPWRRAAPVPRDKPSVAVLPFDDLSPQRDQEHFCEGLADSIIYSLTRVREIRVPGKDSARYLKSKDLSIQEIGKKLNVSAVLDGSIQKSGDRLRVMARLTNVADNSVLWSDRYDKELKDVFSIQDEIALAVVDRMKIQLLGDERAQLAKRPTENLEAYNSYLLGRYLEYKYSEESFTKAIGYFEKAIASDPNYALAYVGQGYCYMGLAHDGYAPPKDAYPKARAAALKAIELDTTIGGAHALLGTIRHVFEWDVAGAELEFQRAIELTPQSTDVQKPYAMYLGEIGRFDEALVWSKRVLELEPTTPANIYALGVNGYFMAGHFDEAITQFQKALDLDPNFLYAQELLAVSYTLKGMHAEAIAQADKVMLVASNSEDPSVLGNLGWVYAKSGKQEIARRFLASLLDLRARRYFDGYCIAYIYAGLDDRDRAFEWITRGYEERACCTIWLKTDPMMKNLRSDPRYQELSRKMGWDKG